jgi:hypothetical protein
MARRNSNTATAEAPAEVTEAPAEVTEAPAEVTEAPIDLTGFQTSVNEAVTTRDAATGVVAEEELAKVTAAYRELEGAKPKNAAKSWVEDQMMEAVGSLDGQLARAYSLAKEALVAGGGSKPAERKPSDPIAAYVAQHAALALAAQVVNASAPEVPEGRDINTEVTELVSANTEALTKFLEWDKSEAEDKGDAPEISPVVRAALKAASGKGGSAKRSTFTGEKGDVGKHIVEAFADHEVGTVLKVSEIANFKSSQYPSGNVSQGAVSARLFPSTGKPTTVVGVEAVERDETGPRRARKTA